MTQKRKLLITEPQNYSQDALDILSEYFSIDFGPLSCQRLLKEIHRYDGILIRLAHHIDANVIEAATNLKFIASPTTGVNHIDMSAAERKSIEVILLRNEFEFLSSIRATPEHTWGLMLALLRNIPEARAHCADGNWDRTLFVGHELFEKTIGIVGYGRVGKIVANYARAFGMEIMAHDPYAEIPDWISSVDMTSLAQAADILTIHIPYNEENVHFIDSSVLGAMKRTAYLINTSRGEVLDEQSLLASLVNGDLAGAALDVLTEEHVSSDFKKHPLVEYASKNNNLILTPHIAGATVESMEKTEIFIARKIIQTMINN